MVTKPATGAHRPKVVLPMVGTITLPPPQHLAFYAVLVALGALEIVEWPVIGIVSIGHMLAHQSHSLSLQQAGEAAEAA